MVSHDGSGMSVGLLQACVLLETLLAADQVCGAAYKQETSSHNQRDTCHMYRNIGGVVMVCPVLVLVSYIISAEDEADMDSRMSTASPS